MNPTDTLSMLIHGASKTGKSTLTSTAPLPICVLDAEGGWRFIKHAGFKGTQPLRKTFWDPNKTLQPPRWDGSWDVCIVTVTQWQTLTNAYRGLTEAQHDFKSLVFDSITEAQRRLKNNLRGMEQMRTQDWGMLLTHMDKLIRDMRDLVVLPNSSLSVVVFVAETTFKNDKWRPNLQGQIGAAIPYFMDVVGYVYRDNEMNSDGQLIDRVLRMLISQDLVPSIEAGERLQGTLPDVITRPNISTMMTNIFGDENIATTTTGGNNQ